MPSAATATVRDPNHACACSCSGGRQRMPIQNSHLPARGLKPGSPTPMTEHFTRYALQLEMLERNITLRDDEAIELLRREFALAQNAGRFDAITPSDIEVGAVMRSTPQEGVTRYVVEAYV